MRLLFVKNSLEWPRSSGHDVFTYHTMKACSELGHEVSLATTSKLSAEAVEGLLLAAQVRLDLMPFDNGILPKATWLQRKFRSFWGVNPAHISALRHTVASTRADVVVIVGLDALPYFPAIDGVARIWFAADEWIWHHLSQFRVGDRRSWSHLRVAAMKGLYERAHTSVVDRVWVVSSKEQRAMRWLAGMRNVDIVPLGVDGEYFRPAPSPSVDRSAVFWGRLDFGPNIQALEWFCRHVWPIVRRKAPDARFTIVGFKPGAEVMALATFEGVSIVADLADLRDAVRAHSLVVLPFVSGGGVKNKLLEAAALGMPVVCTPLATSGLHALDRAPFAIASRPEEMSGAILSIWDDDARRAQMGSRARAWALAHHSWTVTAERAMAPLLRKPAVVAR